MSGLVEGADRWVEALLAVELKGFVLLALVGVAAVALRRASAAGRHWLWTLGVVGLLLLPLAQVAAPRWSAQLPAWATAPARLEGPTSVAVLPPGAVPSARPAPTPVATTGRVAAPASPAARPLPAGGVGAVGARRFSPSSLLAAAPLPAALLALWMLGTLGLLLLVAAGHLNTWRLGARSTSFPEGRVRTLASLLVRHLGIRRPVRLLRGEADAMPVSWGWLRPVVLLPAGAESWSRNRLATVLLHELAHVRRADCLTQLLAEVAVALHWMNPLVWLAAARMRVDREYACDDLVLRDGARASDYADELLALARSFRAGYATPRAAVAMARRSSLAGRLRAVLDATRRRRLGRGRAAGAGALVVLLVGALGALTPAATASRAATADAAADVHAVLGGTLQATSCGTDTRGWKQVSTQSNDDRTRLEWSKPGCEVDVRVEGDIEFTSDFRDVARMDRDARLRFEETEGRTSRSLEITADAGGSPSYTYRVDREERPFDAEARAWYEAMLLQVFRRAGFMARERVAALLREGGVPAVLRELDALDSDFVFTAYSRELLDQAGDLTDAQALDVVERARERVDSDFYLSEILKAFAEDHLDSGAMLDAYLGAAGRIDSDFYRSEVLKVALGRGGLTGDQVGATVAAASSMDSDFYLSEVLTAVASQYVLSPAIRDRYLDAVSSIDSDFYRSEVLGALLARNDLSGAELAVVLRAVGEMDSDSYVDGVLARIPAEALEADALVDAYVDVCAGIDSDHYRAQALGRLVQREGLSDGQLTDLIHAAAGMDSDFYKAQVLSEVARRYRPTGATRDALADAVQTIDSSFYRGQVADLMIR